MYTNIFLLILSVSSTIAVQTSLRSNGSRAISSASSASTNSVFDKGLWSRDSYQYQPDYSSYSGGSSNYYSNPVPNYSDTSTVPSHHGNYGPSPAAYGWTPETTGPTYKYKYHLYPHKASNDKGHQGKGKGNSLGWAEPGRQDFGDAFDGGDALGVGVGVAGIGGVLGVGAAVVLGVLAVGALLLLLSPLLLFIPKLWIAFPGPPNAANQNTTILFKVGRNIPGPFERIQTLLVSGELEDKVENVIGKGRQFFARVFHDLQDATFQGECLERFSCEIQKFLTKYKAEATLQRTFAKWIPSTFSGTKTRIERGMKRQGSCETFTCTRFYK